MKFEIKFFRVFRSVQNDPYRSLHPVICSTLSLASRELARWLRVDSRRGDYHSAAKKKKRNWRAWFYDGITNCRPISRIVFVRNVSDVNRIKGSVARGFIGGFIFPVFYFPRPSYSVNIATRFLQRTYEIFHDKPATTDAMTVFPRV